MKYMKLIVLIMTFTVSLVQAQKNSKNYIGPLHFLKGSWNVNNFEWKNDKWSKLGMTSSIINLEHDGKFIHEKVKYLSKFGEINMLTNIAYDSRLKKFKLCAMDKEYGYMDIYFGEWINNQLVFTNLESDIPVKLNDGRELSFKLTYVKVNNQTFTHLVEGTFDKGKTWFKFSKGTYTKQLK